MTNTAILDELCKSGLHPYGSLEMEEFERHFSQYFEREYSRWDGKENPPESYGVSSFQGQMTPPTTRSQLLKQHYDNDLQIFKAFLDSKYLAYTMAYYGDSPREVKTAQISLEEAQSNKYQLITTRAQIEDGQNILEIGCGFGGFSQYLLERFEHISVTAINPSHVQTNYIRECLTRTEHPFEPKRFNLIQAFFDEVHELQLNSKRFDRVVSLGLLEHIHNMDALFEKISRALAPDGKCFHHCIASIPTIPKLLNSTNTRIHTYFPGGRIWPFAEPLRHDRYLQPADSWFINGLNYWRTLDSWHRRFWESIDHLYPTHIDKRQIEAWNNYFSLCKSMFIPLDGMLYGNAHYLYET